MAFRARSRWCGVPAVPLRRRRRRLRLRQAVVRQAVRVRRLLRRRRKPPQGGSEMGDARLVRYEPSGMSDADHDNNRPAAAPTAWFSLISSVRELSDRSM
jgi:hypothetical protein